MIITKANAREILISIGLISNQLWILIYLVYVTEGSNEESEFAIRPAEYYRAYPFTIFFVMWTRISTVLAHTK